MRQRIRELRSVLNLTQEQFGEKLGVSRDVISNIEGNRAQLRPSFLKHICNFYHVNEGWIAKGEGEMFYKLPYMDPNLVEALALFQRLSPSFQDYALSQIRQLLNVDHD